MGFSRLVPVFCGNGDLQCEDPVQRTAWKRCGYYPPAPGGTGVGSYSRLQDTAHGEVLRGVHRPESQAEHCWPRGRRPTAKSLRGTCPLSPLGPPSFHLLTIPLLCPCPAAHSPYSSPSSFEHARMRPPFCSAPSVASSPTKAHSPPHGHTAPYRQLPTPHLTPGPLHRTLPVTTLLCYPGLH